MPGSRRGILRSVVGFIFSSDHRLALISAVNEHVISVPIMSYATFRAGPGYRVLYVPYVVFVAAAIVSFVSAMVWEPAPGATWWKMALHMACPVSLPLSIALYVGLRWRIRRQVHALSGRCCPACLYPQDPVVGRRCHECGHAFRAIDIADFRAWAKLPPGPPASVQGEESRV